MRDYDADLRRQLATWQVAPVIPPRFQAGVWQRIATRQATREASVSGRLSAWLGAALIQPQYASALAALVVTLSVGVGQLHAREINERQTRSLAASYRSSVDPFARAATANRDSAVSR